MPALNPQEEEGLELEGNMRKWEMIWKIRLTFLHSDTRKKMTPNITPNVSSTKSPLEPSYTGQYSGYRCGRDNIWTILSSFAAPSAFSLDSYHTLAFPSHFARSVVITSFPPSRIFGNTNTISLLLEGGTRFTDRRTAYNSLTA